MEIYIVEVMGEKEHIGSQVFETFSKEEALIFARKHQIELNWFNAGRWYVTLDKYIDGKLIETIDFR